MGDCFSLPCCPAVCGAKKDEQRTVNIFLGFFFMLNLVVGIGFLGIPYAFVTSGVLAGVITLGVSSFVSWNCAIWELEVMARAQAYVDYHSKSHTDKELIKPNFRIELSRKFEPSELCEIFVGKWFKYVYIVALIGTLFLACIAYGTVASSAWAVNIPFNFTTVHQCTGDDFSTYILPPHPSCRNTYWVCLCIFACLVVPLSLLELKDQLIVQVFMGMLRFVAIGSIVIFCIANLSIFKNICQCPVPWLPANDTEEGFCNESTSAGELFTRFNPKAWIVAVPVIVVAFILHQSIPSLTHPIRQKRYLRGYFNVLYIVLTTVYGSLALTVSLWFKDCTKSTCTLSWSDYISFDSTPLRVLSYFLILFPSLDVVSVFPLVVVTLVNNIFTILFGKDTTQVPNTWKYWLIRFSMTLTLSILPIMVSFGVANLFVVLNYTGLFGFVLCYFAPTILQLRSQWLCVKTFEGGATAAAGRTVTAGEAPDYSSDEDNNHRSIAGGPVIQETTPLLLPSRDGSGFEWSTYVEEIKYGFRTYIDKMRTRRDLYVTPYSIWFSYWPAVMIIGSVGVVLFLLTVVGLFAPLMK